MRPFLRFLLLVVLLSLPQRAWAGERKHLGSIVVSGSSLTNATTAVPFVIPLNAKITLYCTAAVQVLTDSTVVTTGTAGTKGVPVPANTLFLTSVSETISVVGGRYSALIAIIGTATCDVWMRLGNE